MLDSRIELLRPETWEPRVLNGTPIIGQSASTSQSTSCTCASEDSRGWRWTPVRPARDCQQRASLPSRVSADHVNGCVRLAVIGLGVGEDLPIESVASGSAWLPCGSLRRRACVNSTRSRRGRAGSGWSDEVQHPVHPTIASARARRSDSAWARLLRALVTRPSRRGSRNVLDARPPSARDARSGGR